MSSSEIAITIIGPSSARTGGMAQYVKEQRHHLKDEVELKVHDIAAVRPESDSQLERFWVYLISSFWTLFEMAQFTQRPQTDIVHIHTTQSIESARSMFYALYSSFVWRSKVVLHIHGSSYEEFFKTNSSILMYFQSVLFGTADSIIVISERLEDILSSRIPEEKLFLLPNAVNTGDFDPDPRTDPPKVVFLSFHTERKGIRELETAIDRLNAKSVNMEVELVGEGPLAERSEILAQRHSNVTYHGYVSERMKQRILEKAAVLVLPSRAECVPLVILEAMAGGTAIISTTVGGIPEVISEEHGILVPPANADLLTEALSILLENPDRIKSMATKNRKLAEEQYDWNLITNHLIKHYEELSDQTDSDVPILY